jgi:hypothetical protein
MRLLRRCAQLELGAGGVGNDGQATVRSGLRSHHHRAAERLDPCHSGVDVVDVPVALEAFMIPADLPPSSGWRIVV